MVETIIPLIGPEPLSPDWFALRKYDAARTFPAPVCFGATKAAACCGLSPYATPLEVFVECLMGYDKEVTEAMEFGRDFEDAVLNIYERKLTARLREPVKMRRKLPMFIHGQHRYMGATPDAIVVDPTEWLHPDDRLLGGWKYGVDAKTSTYRRLDKEGTDPLKFGIEGTDQLPIDYVLQAQQQCAVLNLPYVEFPVLFSREFVPIYRVERNEDLIHGITLAENEMFERLVNNDPPEPNWTHENTRELIGVLHGYQEDVVKQLDEEDADQWLNVQRWRDGIKEREEWITEVNNKLLFKLHGASAGILPSGNEQIKRIVVKESKVTQKDVDDLRERVGQTKRRGYEFLKQGKVK